MDKAKKTEAKNVSAPKAPALAVLGHGVGRRKSSVARVWLRRGKGLIVINGKDIKDYFDSDISINDAVTVCKLLPHAGGYDIDVNVNGGGLYSQAGAVRLGIARAFVSNDESIRPLLRKHSLLTVDARKKERKKYGQKAARRKFQFVKR